MSTNDYWASGNGLDVGDYYVLKVALHLIDRKLGGATLSEHEINLKAFTEPNDILVIRDFLQLHLKAICEAEEGIRTRPASSQTTQLCEGITIGSKMTSSYSLAAPGDGHSLHTVSKGSTASAGLLVVVLFARRGASHPSLALLKMDYKRDNRIALKKGPSGEVLLDLAVQYTLTRLYPAQVIAL